MDTPQEQTQQLYTCVSCHVAFYTPDAQRDHYKTEWHRYNLKRKVSSMPPVTLVDFNARVKAQQQSAQEEQQRAEFQVACEYCHKTYTTQNAYDNHVQSKKHKEMVAKGLPVKVRTPPVEPRYKPFVPDETLVTMEAPSEFDDVDEKILNAVKLELTDCLFCVHKATSLENIMTHMSAKHSFFVPDLTFCIDLEGLMKYLGEKISIGNMCLMCNEKGKTFRSLEAVRKHMTDKGHCQLAVDNDAELEYSDYYDFRPSYPDFDPEKPHDEDDEIGEVAGVHLDNGGYEMVLASGAKLGHRSMRRFYKQKFRPEEDRNSVLISRLMSQYKALGWHSQPIEFQREQKQQIRDQQHRDLHIGIKANNQAHFRHQIIF